MAEVDLLEKGILVRREEGGEVEQVGLELVQGVDGERAGGA